ncbi:MAG: MarR family transcriptional regulator [Candidatus Limivivens sp.]|nr:MarR family transcriptional regulator [Candidatus Limivivens sp.]
MKPKRTVGFVVHSLDNMINRRLLAYGASLGIDNLTLMNGWIIGYLCDNPDRDIFQRDIEAEFSIARSTVTGIIKLMEKKGYLRRESVPNDARLKKLVLTPKGIDIHQKTLHDFATVEAELTRGITPEELETFYTIIEKLRKNVE